MHVITGGSGSGKSAYAEMWLTGKPEKRYGNSTPDAEDTSLREPAGR